MDHKALADHHIALVVLHIASLLLPLVNKAVDRTSVVVVVVDIVVGS